MKLKFWGVMGSCPGANPELVEYGIATPCVEINIGNRVIIFDCGTGAAVYSKTIPPKMIMNLDMFLTHTHWDHIQGFPFFSPLYHSKNVIKIYGEKREGFSLKQILKDSVKNPYFPVDWEQFDANIEYIELESAQILDLGDNISVKTLETFHPDRNLAYRIESEGKGIVYLTDFDHGNLSEEKVISFIQNADVLIYDAHFTDEEYSTPKYKGWGHSTWQKGIEFARAANVKRLFLFHHAPHRTKDEMLSIEGEIAKIKKDVKIDIQMAKEGLSVEF